MKLLLIGSNGFLADSIGKFCNKKNIEIEVWGLKAPIKYNFNKFNYINLLTHEVNMNEAVEADLIIYAAGAGVQFSQIDSYNKIYHLNTFVPIKIIKELTRIKFKGYIVTFGSYFEFGENNINKFLKEKDIIYSSNPVPNDYCVSKRLLTRFITSTRIENKYLHFILPTIYGEHENSNRLIPYLINAIKNKEVIKVTTGEQVRQYLYVDDVAPILFDVIKKNITSAIYNISGGENFAIKNLVNFILKYFNYPLKE